MTCILAEGARGAAARPGPKPRAQAVRAGYTVRPAWGRVTTGAALEGLTLSWKSLDDDRTAPLSWFEARQEPLQRAARRGKTSVTLHDTTAAAAPAWVRRREILQRAGFTTELIPGEAGATLVVRWWRRLRA